MAEKSNPLLRDRDVDFLLYEVLDAPRALRAAGLRRARARDVRSATCRARAALAREVLFPAYRPMDEAPPRLANGSVTRAPAHAARSGRSWSSSA